MGYHAEFTVNPDEIKLFTDSDPKYAEYKQNAEQQLLEEFMHDFGMLSVYDVSEEMPTRSYAPLLLPIYDFGRIVTERATLLEEVYYD